MEAKNIELGVVPEKECKIVSDAAISRKLLKDGFRIVDIKPKRGHTRESIFVFEVVPGFMEKMGEYVAERKASKEEKKEK